LDQTRTAPAHKAKAARTLDTLEAQLKPTLDTITAKDANGWIRHTGYALH
jgi:hypothetical protein